MLTVLLATPGSNFFLVYISFRSLKSAKRPFSWRYGTGLWRNGACIFCEVRRFSPRGCQPTRAAKYRKCTDKASGFSHRRDRGRFVGRTYRFCTFGLHSYPKCKFLEGVPLASGLLNRYHKQEVPLASGTTWKWFIEQVPLENDTTCKWYHLLVVPLAIGTTC